MTDSSKPAQNTPPCKRSPCGVACTLDLLGDKWTLLVVRDLFLGKQTFGELQASQEGIPTNMLADRLKRLQSEGIVSRSCYQERPRRYTYHLTDKGKDLMPILRGMMRWANKYVPGSLTPAQVKQMVKAGRFP